jgi:PAS domain S-box-containing protein
MGRLRPLGFLFWVSTLLPLGAAASFSWILYERSLADLASKATQTAAIVREQALRVFDAQQSAMAVIDLRLSAMSWDEIRQSASIRDFLAGLMQSSPKIAAILVIDPDGRLAANGDAAMSSAAAIMEPAYVQALRAQKGIYLGPTVQEGNEDGIGFALGRRGPGPSDAFDGAILIATKARYFEDFWSTLAARSPDVISIIRDDGAFLARFAETGKKSAAIPPTSPFFELSRARRTGLYRVRSSIDGGDRLYAFSKLGRFPAYVRVGIDRDAALAPWRTQAMLLIVIAAGVSLALATLVRMEQAREARLFAEIDRRQRAETNLIARDEHVAAMHKAETRLLLIGQRFRVAIGVMAGIVYDWRISSGEVYRSDGLSRLLGFRADKARADLAWWMERVHPDDLPGFEAQLANYAAGAIEETAQEYRVRHRDGRWIYVWDRGSLIRDHTSRPVRVIGSAIDITERKEVEERQQVLINELNHRVKNTLATVQSITVQTARNASDPPDMAQRLQERFLALSKAHDQLIRTSWECVDLQELIESELSPYEGTEIRIEIAGPPVKLNAATGVALALVLHELATNASKYGALSTASGRLEVVWSIERGDPPKVRMKWREYGVPGAANPGKRGFGTRLIERGLVGVGGGSTSLEFRAGGVICLLDMPLFTRATRREN